MNRVLVTGAGGFIGSHLVARLVGEGAWVRGVDLEESEFRPIDADEFLRLDLRDPAEAAEATSDVDTMFALAANMGGIGWTHSAPAEILRDNLLISTNSIEQACRNGVQKVVFASSACVYPRYLQSRPDAPALCEDVVFPADPDREYGWEKLTSEILYGACRDRYGIDVKIVRLHGIYGPYSTYDGLRAKSLAMLCRKVADVEEDAGEVEVWGDGTQRRSYCYVDDCVEGLLRIAASELVEPINLGSDVSVSIAELVERIARVAGKSIRLRFDATRPVGPLGRNSDNSLIRQRLGWAPSTPLDFGLVPTYQWIAEQLRVRAAAGAAGPR